MIDRFPPRYLLPNAVTAGSLLLALAALVAAARGGFESAAWLIVWCALLDRVDGVVARLARATSEFGVQFDTLADLLAFGVAPGLFAYLLLHGDARYAPAFAAPAARALLTGATAIYVLAAALRLARFNVQTQALGPAWSRGLPVTIAGALVALYALTAWDLGWPDAALRGLPVVLLVLAFFMLSNLWLPKSAGRVTRPWLAAQTLLAVVIYALGCLRREPWFLLLAALAYPGLGFIWGALRPPAREAR